MLKLVRVFAVLLTISVLLQPAAPRTAFAAAGDTTADRVLGQTLFTTATAGTTSSRFNSSGAMNLAIDRASGRLFVSDAGNHRILSWPSATGFSDGQAADLVLGQADFTGVQPNRGNLSPSAASLNSPHGLAIDSAGRLFVADYFNHRVIGYSPPFTTGQSADVLIGQEGFGFPFANRNNLGPSADSLKNPIDLAFQDNGDLWVVDHGNFRVLHYAANHIFDNAADIVLGQPNLDSALQAVAQNRFSDPYGIAVSPSGDKVYVAENLGNRVLLFQTPYATDEMATGLWGQSFYTTSTPNNGGVSGASLSGPASVAIDAFGRLFVADYGNNRVLRFDGLVTAAQVFGQAGSYFSNSPGTSAFWLRGPDGIAIDGAGNLYVADSANFRVLGFDRPVQYGAPLVSSLMPKTIGAGLPAATVNVYGSGFTTASSVRVGVAGRTTTYRGETWLQAQLTAADLANPGASLQISVLNPAPGGSASTALTLTTYIRAAFDGFADAVLGQPDFSSFSGTASNSIRQSGSAAVAVNPVTGRLYITDRNGRILSWPSGAAYVNGQEADLVIGMSSPFVAPPVAGSPPSQRTLNIPIGLAVDPAGNLWVVDAGNNRVLRFDAPQSNGMAASVVLGQLSFTTRVGTAGERGMFEPDGLALDSAGRLAVTEQENNRVLIFDPPFSTGQAASIVLGQPDFITTTPGLSDRKLDDPVGLAFAHNRDLFVSDTANNRVLVFPYPQSTNQAATIVIGQTDFMTNTSGLSASKMKGPRPPAFDSNGYFYLPDTTSNRILVFKSPFTSGMAASFVIGQSNFTTGSFGTSASKFQSLVGLAIDASRNLFSAELGNNRILRFDTPIATPPPFLSSISPSTVNRGFDVVLTIKGSEFVLPSKVLWNGAERPTTFVDGNTLTVSIPASDAASVGTANVSVQSPGPGGGTTGPLPVIIVQPVFTVLAPVAAVQAVIQ